SQLLRLSTRGHPPQAEDPTSERPNLAARRAWLPCCMHCAERGGEPSRVVEFGQFSGAGSPDRRLGRQLAPSRDLPLRLVASKPGGWPLWHPQPHSREDADELASVQPRNLGCRFTPTF